MNKIYVKSWSNFFIIYINDLSDDFFSNPKLFADDKSLFSVASDKDLTAKHPVIIYRKNVTGPINGKWASALNLF